MTNSSKDWEIVHHRGSAERTERLRVPGGWLWRTRVWDKSDGTCVGLTFQPDSSPPTRE
jgi:hypothetical protein